MTSSNGNIFRVTGRLCGGIHRSLVNSPHKDQWRGALMFSLISSWINGWVNKREAGDLRRHCAYHDVVVLDFLTASDRQVYFEDSGAVELRTPLDIWLESTAATIQHFYAWTVGIVIEMCFILIEICVQTYKYHKIEYRYLMNVSIFCQDSATWSLVPMIGIDLCLWKYAMPPELLRTTWYPFATLIVQESILYIVWQTNIRFVLCLQFTGANFANFVNVFHCIIAWDVLGRTQTKQVRHVVDVSDSFLYGMYELILSCKQFWKCIYCIMELCMCSP